MNSIFELICEYSLQIIIVFIFVKQDVMNTILIPIPRICALQIIFVFVFVPPPKKKFQLHQKNLQFSADKVEFLFSSPRWRWGWP